MAPASARWNNARPAPRRLSGSLGIARAKRGYRRLTWFRRASAHGRQEIAMINRLRHRLAYERGLSRSFGSAMRRSAIA